MAQNKLLELAKPVGKLGNRVYYFWRGDYRSRAYVIPVQPGTASQKKTWLRMKKKMKDWRMLNPPVQLYWNELAKPLQMSGMNLYLKLFLW